MSESKTPRTDEIAQRHLAGCDIVTCYHYAIRLANDLETELAASHAREAALMGALESLDLNESQKAKISWVATLPIVADTLEAWRAAK